MPFGKEVLVLLQQVCASLKVENKQLLGSTELPAWLSVSCVAPACVEVNISTSDLSAMQKVLEKTMEITGNGGLIILIASI